jgi:hypothetical protein
MSFNFIFEDEDEEIDLTEPEEDELGLSFEEEIPERKRITDPEVRPKAQGNRKRRVSTLSYDGKMAAGWSYLCSHKEHLPNLCEREQDADKVTCSCPCHSERGYVYQQSEYIPGSDDDEIISLFD